MIDRIRKEKISLKLKVIWKTNSRNQELSSRDRKGVEKEELSHPVLLAAGPAQEELLLQN